MPEDGKNPESWSPEDKFAGWPRCHLPVIAVRWLVRVGGSGRNSAMAAQEGHVIHPHRGLLVGQVLAHHHAPTGLTGKLSDIANGGGERDWSAGAAQSMVLRRASNLSSECSKSRYSPALKSSNNCRSQAKALGTIVR